MPPGYPRSRRRSDVTRKLYIRTFGCQMNEYDSDRMADVLAESDGLEPTDRPEDADVILFNTCSVREKAQERVFHDLGRVRAIKAARPDVIIGVGGCVASQEGGAIVKRAPYVDVVFGPQTLHRLPDLIRARRETGRSQVDTSFPEIEKFDHLPPPRVEGASAPRRRRWTSAFPRSRSSTTCHRRASRAQAPSSPSWRAAPNTAATAWCPTPAAKRSACLLYTSDAADE